jgi:protein TonB
MSSAQPIHVERLTVAFSQDSNLLRPDSPAPEAAADNLGGGSTDAAPPQAARPIAERKPQESPVVPKPEVPSGSQETKTGPPLVVSTSSTSRAAVEASASATPPPEPVLSASALINQARRLARLSTSTPLDSTRSDQGEHSGADTRFSVREAYVDTWIRKVEEWGTRNFPDTARRQHLTGSLTLNVVLRYDGTIHEIKLLRSSGHQVLDDAAFRIVHLAAPFAPFPKDLRQQQGDFLTIKRTWQFLQDSRLSSG